ncbi:hypothetical protein Micbo1qcDRAFT_181386, partial [Microdochium bolleyi]
MAAYSPVSGPIFVDSRSGSPMLDIFDKDEASSYVYPVTPPYESEEFPSFSNKASLLPLPSASEAEAWPLDVRPFVAVIGVGYVGTHLVENFSREYDTLGFDISPKRVAELQRSFASNGR